MSVPAVMLTAIRNNPKGESSMKLNLHNANLKITAGAASQFPVDTLPQIAFAGRSNVGKSSLVNSLLQRKSLARVSATPGKTITINFYDIDKKLYLVDLPGYGYAKRTASEQRKWSMLTDGYFTKNQNIDKLCLVVQLVDSRVGPTKDDIDMLYFLQDTETPHIIVATKCDKLNRTERNKFDEIIGSCEAAQAAKAVIMYSSKSGEGRDDLWKAIINAAESL